MSLKCALRRLSIEDKMALMIAVEETTKSRKAEQAKIHESIQIYKEILNINRTSQLTPGLETTNNPPPATSLVEKEEIYLLEKALEKALRIRCGVDPSLKRSKTVKPPGNQNVQGATCASTKKASNEHTKNSLISKTNKHKERKAHSLGHTKGFISNSSVEQVNVTSKKIETVSVHGTEEHRQNSLYRQPKNQMEKGQVSGKNVHTTSVSKLKDSEGNKAIQQKQILLEEASIWANLKRMEHRLWDKIFAFETKSLLSARDQFLERIRVTFPMTWPCSSPCKIQALLNKVTQQGENFTEDLIVKQTSEEEKEMGGMENIHDSNLSFRRPKISAKDIRKLAAQVKQEWESWDRQRPEWGCLCPTVADSEWITASLPMTVTYTTERDLRELETLRMRVALLQQEVFLEMTLSETLSPNLSSIVHRPLNPNLLRELYSLLGEGGERFPAIVLDSEPDS